ncbi:hypothetical protein M407DRAFT_242657 [Tulasnella calospora MUT 4182]|uniref:ATP synthase subunit K, mitochondrial n=1 Tax=Tulasnella calospora MUT 4182 TaxID=1051891 RepID=A0A0C3QPL5_9AGAM|nr:hypothetical protein M407DRAFT_242657 [Tulasnella calospora MUT 4182]
MSYVIAGRAIKSEYLALGTLFSTGLLAYASMGGKKAAPAGSSAPIVVPDASKDEQDFVRQFIEAAEKEEAHHK